MFLSYYLFSGYNVKTRESENICFRFDNKNNNSQTWKVKSSCLSSVHDLTFDMAKQNSILSYMYKCLIEDITFHIVICPNLIKIKLLVYTL